MIGIAPHIAKCRKRISVRSTMLGVVDPLWIRKSEIRFDLVYQSGREILKWGQYYIVADD